MLESFLRSPAKSLGLIFAAALAVRLNIFGNEFVMDDFAFIIDWPLIESWANFPKFFIGYTPPPGQEGIYSPLKTVFHAINFTLFGREAFGHHLVSLLVHFTGITYVYKIIRHLTNDNIIPFLVSLMFAVHPVQVEAITYMTASVDMIGIVFLFVSFYHFILFRSERENKKKHYHISLLFAGLAVFTHELAISLPVLFLWYDICFSGPNDGRDIFKRNAPFFAVAAAYALVKWLVLGTVTRGGYIEGSFYLTMLVTIKAFAKYVLIALFPFELTHNHVIAEGIYSFDPSDFDKYAVLSQSIFDWPTLGSFLLLAGIGYFVCWTYDKSRLAAFCAGWFFLSLLPVSNIIPSGVYFGERYLYPGLWAFCVLLVLGLQWMYRRGGYVRQLSGVLFILFVLWSCLLTWDRNRDWKTEVRLYESAVEANPQSALMRTDLGLVYKRYGFFEKAVQSFRESIALRGDDPVTHFALAKTYQDVLMYEQAAEAYHEALALDPDYAEAYYNLAGIYAYWDQNDRAKDYLEKSLKIVEERDGPKEAETLQKAFYDYFEDVK